jgi:hypothetical protein
MMYEEMSDEWKESIELSPIERFRQSEKYSPITRRWGVALIPTLIRQVLSTLRTNGVQALLMGGQACVFYGAAQVSKVIDLVLLAEPARDRAYWAPLKAELEAFRGAERRKD